MRGCLVVRHDRHGRPVDVGAAQFLERIVGQRVGTRQIDLGIVTDLEFVGPQTFGRRVHSTVEVVVEVVVEFFVELGRHDDLRELVRRPNRRPRPDRQRDPPAPRSGRRRIGRADRCVSSSQSSSASSMSREVGVDAHGVDGVSGRSGSSSKSSSRIVEVVPAEIDVVRFATSPRAGRRKRRRRLRRPSSSTSSSSASTPSASRSCSVVLTRCSVRIRCFWVPSRLIGGAGGAPSGVADPHHHGHHHARTRPGPVTVAHDTSVAPLAAAIRAGGAGATAAQRRRAPQRRPPTRHGPDRERCPPSCCQARHDE